MAIMSLCYESSAKNISVRPKAVFITKRRAFLPKFVCLLLFGYGLNRTVPLTTIV